MTARQPPPPRPSGQTTVGLGVIEGERARALEPLSREDPVTPPSGTDADALRRGDVSLLLQEIHSARADTDDRIDRVEAKVDALRDEALFALLGTPEAVRKHGEQLSALTAAVRSLDVRIGHPPSTEDFARASQVDATPEQIAQLEQDHKLGTGLWRFVMSMHLRTSSSTRVAVGVGGGGGAVLGAVLSELLRLAF